MFCKAIIPFDPRSSLQVAGVLFLALALILALGEITEQRREPWRRLFRKVFGLPLYRAAQVPTSGAAMKVA